MAGNNNQEKSSKRYFRTPIAGLSVVVDSPDEGQVVPKTVRFTPYVYKTEVGEELLFGYLETDNKKAIAALEVDSNVTEIDQESFEKYTDLDNERIRKAAL